jgi:pimeloyl-ACP methyl ester carboxylesterase
VSAPAERTVEVNGHACRVWEKGDGDPVGYLAGPFGLTRWTPFLDALAERHRVVVPSLPGFPGATGHDELDDLADWVTATLDLLDAAGLDGADLIGVSVGATLAAEVAAFSRHTVRRLVLVAPFGIHVAEDPVPNFFAANPKQMPALVCADRAHADAQLTRPDGVDEVEWSVITARAITAGARLLWPMCDTRLVRRLHRISAPTLIVWGEDDEVIGTGYAKRFAAGIDGPVETFVVPGAGHHADWDRPAEVSERVRSFLSS